MESLPDKRDLLIAEFEAENARLRVSLEKRGHYCAKLAAQREQILINRFQGQRAWMCAGEIAHE